MVDTIRVIAAKKEAVYGTDIVPTLANVAILTRNFQSVPVETDQIDRNLDGGGYGASAGKPSNIRTRSTYEVELAGSGAAGTAAKWQALLEVSGLAAPVIVVATSATQKFAKPTDDASSLSEYHWVGDQRRKALGQRGTFSLDFTAGALPYASLNMLGVVPAITPRDVAVPGAASFAGWIEPLEVNNENSVLMLGGYGVTARSLTVDAGVNVNLRSLMGARYVKRGNHSATGRAVIEAPSQATKDYLATLQTGDLIPISLVHGTVAGNIVELSATKVQITSIAEGDEDDTLMFDIGLLFTTDGGADDLVIITK